MIISMDMVSLRGLMDVDMLDIGPRAGSMVSVSIVKHQTTRSNLDSGKMEKLSNGLMNNRKLKLIQDLLTILNISVIKKAHGFFLNFLILSSLQISSNKLTH